MSNSQPFAKQQEFMKKTSNCEIVQDSPHTKCSWGIREQNIFGLLSNLYHLRILQAFVEQELLGFSNKE